MLHDEIYALSLADMNTQNIVIGLIVVMLLGGGAYWYKIQNQASVQSDQEAAPQTSNQTGTTTNQVQGQEVKIGTGKLAAPDMEVSVLYEGRLQDGTVFDSSATHDNKPLVFILGTPGIIPGFQIGVNGMREGGERAILVPPSLGYGSQAVGTIPANSSLIFKINLIKVAATSTTATKTR